MYNIFLVAPCFKSRCHACHVRFPPFLVVYHFRMSCLTFFGGEEVWKAGSSRESPVFSLLCQTQVSPTLCLSFVGASVKCGVYCRLGPSSCYGNTGNYATAQLGRPRAVEEVRREGGSGGGRRGGGRRRRRERDTIEEGEEVRKGERNFLDAGPKIQALIP